MFWQCLVFWSKITFEQNNWFVKSPFTVRIYQIGLVFARCTDKYEMTYSTHRAVTNKRCGRPDVCDGVWRSLSPFELSKWIRLIEILMRIDDQASWLSSSMFVMESIRPETGAKFGANLPCYLAKWRTVDYQIHFGKISRFEKQTNSPNSFWVSVCFVQAIVKTSVGKPPISALQSSYINLA